VFPPVTFSLHTPAIRRVILLLFLRAERCVHDLLPRGN
jgi:hypothetical protein